MSNDKLKNEPGKASIEKFMDIHGIEGCWSIMQNLLTANQSLLFNKNGNEDEVLSIIDCQLLLMDILREHYGVDLE